MDSEDHEVAAMVLVDVHDDRPEDSEDHLVVMDYLRREVPELVVTKLETAHQT